MPPVRFRPHHVPVLREAAAELRARTAEEDVAVVGDVAHEQTRQVTVRGNLVRRGTRYYLAGASGFRILTDTDAE